MVHRQKIDTLNAVHEAGVVAIFHHHDSAVSEACLLYTSPSPRDKRQSRMPSSA